jgi:hypothetical protein
MAAFDARSLDLETVKRFSERPSFGFGSKRRRGVCSLVEARWQTSTRW